MKFYFFRNNKYEEVEGKKLHLEFLDVFIFKDKPSRWIVGEPITGAIVGVGTTKKYAIDDAKSKLQHYGEIETLKKMISFIEENNDPKNPNQPPNIIQQLKDKIKNIEEKQNVEAKN